MGQEPRPWPGDEDVGVGFEWDGIADLCCGGVTRFWVGPGLHQRLLGVCCALRRDIRAVWREHLALGGYLPEAGEKRRRGGLREI